MQTINNNIAGGEFRSLQSISDISNTAIDFVRLGGTMRHDPSRPPEAEVGFSPVN